MDDHSKELAMLAGTSKRAKPALPHSAPTPVYDFENLGAALADSLSAAAEDLVKEAQSIADQARRLAAEIRATVDEQARLLADINARLRASGEQMLEAHRKFNGS